MKFAFALPHEFNDPFDCSVVYAQHEGSEDEAVADFLDLARRQPSCGRPQELVADSECRYATGRMAIDAGAMHH